MTRRLRSSKRSEPTDVLDEVNERFRDLAEADNESLEDHAPVDDKTSGAASGDSRTRKAKRRDSRLRDSDDEGELTLAGAETDPPSGGGVLMTEDVAETAVVTAGPTDGRSRSRSRSRRRAGGRVAPFVEPPGRFARWRKLQGWRRQGFVPLSPGREKRRHRILPRTVIGICTMLMSAGIGAGFAGAGFYAYYDDRLAENEAQVAGFVETFDTQFSDAAMAIEGQRDAALEDVRAELLPLEAYVADANGVSTLPDVAGPSVWSVRSLDDSGRATSGSAFAVIDHEGGTGLITQLDVVLASTLTPPPPIELVKGDRVIQATLWAWDEVNGLALIVTTEALPLLEIADTETADLLLGRSVFAVSGFGARGATASPGLMLDRSTQGLQHTAALGPVFNGGPIVDGFGQVLGMTTSDVAPEFGDIKVAVDASVFCQRVLRCVNGFEAGSN